MAVLEITPDNENCRIEISIQMQDTVVENRSFYLQRSSAEKGLDAFESLIKFADFSGTKYYYDYIVEPGMLYKYRIAELVGSNYQDRSSASPGLGMVDSSGSFLLGNSSNKQINFVYNAEISDFKTNVKDNIIEPLGSQFPFVIRGAYSKYKQFSFSGMAISYSDSLRKLTNLTYSQLLKPNSNPVDEVNNYYEAIGLDKNYNYILEKEYRKILTEWLIDGSMKIFKSDTEGLFIGRLTEVSFQPVKETGRVIYNTSFTFTELAESSIDNYRSYGFLPQLDSNYQYLKAQSEIGTLNDNF